MGQPRAKPTEGTASICASSRRSERNPLGEGSKTGSACSGTAPQPSLKATRLVGKGGKATQGVCRECPRLCLWLCRWILVYNNNHLHRVQPSSALHLENRFTAVQMGWFVFGEGQKCQGVALGREKKKIRFEEFQLSVNTNIYVVTTTFLLWKTLHPQGDCPHI